jgi:hypothetical protein
VVEAVVVVEGEISVVDVVVEPDVDVELEVVLVAAVVLLQLLSAKTTRAPSSSGPKHRLSSHHCECTNAHLRRQQEDRSITRSRSGGPKPVPIHGTCVLFMRVDL